MKNKLEKLPESFKDLNCNGIRLMENPLVSLSNINFDVADTYSFNVNNLISQGKGLISHDDEGYACDSTYPLLRSRTYTSIINSNGRLPSKAKQQKIKEKLYVKTPVVLSRKICAYPLL